MTDKDVVEKLNSLVPGGHIYLRKYSGDKFKWKPLWQWQLHRRPDVIPVLEAIRPYMGERRGKRIDEILEYHAANPRWASREGRKCELGCSCGRHKDHIGFEQRSSWHKGKPKSEDHRRKISESHKKLFDNLSVGD